MDVAGMMQEDRALGSFHYVDELRIFDSESLEFIKPKINGLAPAARAYHYLNLVGDKIITFGGWRGASFKSVFAGGALQQSERFPMARRIVAAGAG